MTTTQSETWAISSANATEATLSEWDILKKEASELLPYKVGRGIQTYWLPIIIPLGIIGNTLSFLVMMRPHNRKVSCCVYMASLAVADNVMLINAGYYWYITDIARRPWFRTECYLFGYLFHVFSLASAMLIVILTIDRFIAICHPLKRTSWCTHTKARHVAIFVFPVTFLVELPYYFFVRIIDKTTCAGFGAQGRASLVLSWVYMFINAWLPFIAIIILNTYIIVTVRRSTKLTLRDNGHSRSTVTSIGSGRCEAPSTGEASNDLRASRDKQLLVMLLLVSFALLVLLLPIHIRYVAFLFINQYQSADALALYVLLYNFTNKLAVTNSAVNFILYSIAGSRFRQDLREMLACWAGDDTCEENNISHSHNALCVQVDLRLESEVVL